MPRIIVGAADEQVAVTFDWPIPPSNTPTVARLDPVEEIRSGRAVSFESLTRDTDARATSTVDGRQFLAWGPGVFSAIAARVPNGKSIAEPRAITHEINTPGYDGVKGAGAWRKNLGSTGFIGAVPPGTRLEDRDPRRTTLRIKPNTGMQKNIVGSAVQLGYSGSVRYDLANVEIEHTDQGMQSPSGTGENSGPGNDGTSHRISTAVLSFNTPHESTWRDLLITGAPGNNGAPPGESFLGQMYGSGSFLSRDCVMARVHTDGRQKIGGPIWSAVGLTSGNTLRQLVVGCSSHHNGQGGFVAFQAFDGQVFDLTLGDPDDQAAHVDGKITNLDWLNLELADNWTFTRPRWLTNKPAAIAKQREAISHSGDGRAIHGRSTMPGKLTIIDPDYRGPMKFNAKPVIMVSHWGPPTYSPSNENALNPPVIRTAKGAPILYRRNFGPGWHTVNAS